MRIRRHVTRQARGAKDAVDLETRAHQGDDNDKLGEPLGDLRINQRRRPEGDLR